MIVLYVGMLQQFMLVLMWGPLFMSFGAHWRRSCSRDTNTPSAIQMLCVKLRYINLFWHWHCVDRCCTCIFWKLWITGSL